MTIPFTKVFIFMERLEDVLKFNPPLRAKKKVIIKIIKQNSNKEKKRKQKEKKRKKKKRKKKKETF